VKQQESPDLLNEGGRCKHATEGSAHSEPPEFRTQGLSCCSRQQQPNHIEHQTPP
jgi:hypothetical protein